MKEKKDVLRPTLFAWAIGVATRHPQVAFAPSPSSALTKEISANPLVRHLNLRISALDRSPQQSSINQHSKQPPAYMSHDDLYLNRSCKLPPR